MKKNRFYASGTESACPNKEKHAPHQHGGYATHRHGSCSYFCAGVGVVWTPDTDHFKGSAESPGLLNGWYITEGDVEPSPAHQA